MTVLDRKTVLPVVLISHNVKSGNDGNVATLAVSR